MYLLANLEKNDRVATELNLFWSFSVKSERASVKTTRVSITHGCVDVLILNLFMQYILCLYTFDTVHSDCIGSFSAWRS